MSQPIRKTKRATKKVAHKLGIHNICTCCLIHVILLKNVVGNFSPKFEAAETNLRQMCRKPNIKRGDYTSIKQENRGRSSTCSARGGRITSHPPQS